MTPLHRFLLAGSDDGCYRATDPAPRPERAAAVYECLRSDGLETVKAVLVAARSGRVPETSPLLFVLAQAASPRFACAEANSAALDAMPSVVRTAGQLFEFVSYASAVRGWGRGLRAAVAGWYLAKPLGELERQILKYPEGHGWTHADLIRMSHPEASTASRNALFRWVVTGEKAGLFDHGLWQADAVERLRVTRDESEAARLVRDFRLPQTTVPERWSASPEVWEALFESMPLRAILSNFDALEKASLAGRVAERLTDPIRIARSQIHPIVFARARASHGNGAFRSALDIAWQLAIRNVQPRFRVLVDEAPEMQQPCNGEPNWTAAEAAKVLAASLGNSETGESIYLTHACAGSHARVVVTLCDAAPQPAQAGQLRIAGFNEHVPQRIAAFLDSDRPEAARVSMR